MDEPINARQQVIVRIGTSGIVLPGTKLTFPNEFKKTSRLHYYSSLFNTVEINSSFYKMHLAKTYEKWASEVPETFAFTIKLWREITHKKTLQYSESDIDLFMSTIKTSGSKSGCILIQFPASIDIHYLKKVESILERISQQNSRQQWQLAIELRHTSWYCDRVYKVFRKHNAAIVFHDMPASTTPSDCPTTHLIYCRFHGPTGNYNGSYTAEQIHLYAEQINQWQKSASNIYIYFNNTIGSAFENAQLLKSFI